VLSGAFAPAGLFFRVTRRIGFFTDSCSDATATLASLNSNSSEDIGSTPTEKGKYVAPHLYKGTPSAQFLNL
jgi:hypothetical protein